MLVIGIDPGVSGALAVMSDGVLLDVIDVPTMAKGRGNKRQVNASALASWLQEYDSATAWIEQVSSMPKQGVSSTFGFGEAFGVLRGVAAGLFMPIELVTPQIWKRRFSLIGADKDLARTRACELFPSASLPRKKDVGRADAILIAQYGFEISRQRVAS